LRLTITLEPPAPLDLPVHYTHLLQGLIYRQIDAALAAWLHEEAYRTPNRRFKLFTFSRLEPAGTTRYRVHQGRIHFDGPVRFTLASINTDLLCSLAEQLLKAPDVPLGPHTCTVRGVEVLKPPSFDPTRPIRVRALSPITTHSTLLHPSGSKKTYYYSPFENDWHQQLRQNLVHKAQALGWNDDPQAALAHAAFRPVHVKPNDQKIITYKNTVIKGWLGTYDIAGVSQAYFELLYDAGLGDRNAQGFGMVEVV
jgi:CRISPR-associated endoribonuclease Cas6